MVIFIYSRKSKWTGRGESVENQLAMCRDYIQCHIEGVQEAEVITYEDEGYSGKNTNRPQFQKMMQEIEKGNCNYLVCYKLDRLGRNIGDLANLVETLNQWNVSFISIKEQFDTSTPIGKAMLYFAGVLAQMEREQIAERVRDNMVMLARKGRWLGGNTPLGFMAEAEEKISVNGKGKKSFRLAVNEAEMQTVRFIFREYLEKQSLTSIVRYFLNHGIRTKRGREYTAAALRDILTNPVYCTADKEAYEYFWNLGCQVCMEKEEADGAYGLIAYAKTSSTQYKNKNNSPEKWIIAVGRHPGIISGKDFSKIQAMLAKNSSKGEGWHKSQHPLSLLSGVLYCSCGHRMRPKNYSSQQVTDTGERRFSYRCPYKDMTHGEKCSMANVQGNMLDELVCQEVLRATERNFNIFHIVEKAVERVKEPREENIDTLDFLKQEVQRRKREIQNLIRVLAKFDEDEVIVQQIKEEISKLKEECKTLERERVEFKEEGGSIREENGQTRNSLEQFSSFSNIFDVLTVPEKREYLQMILQKIVWDGREAHICVR